MDHCRASVVSAILIAMVAILKCRQWIAHSAIRRAIVAVSVAILVVGPVRLLSDPQSSAGRPGAASDAVGLSEAPATFPAPAGSARRGLPHADLFTFSGSRVASDVPCRFARGALGEPGAFCAASSRARILFKRQLQV